MALQPASIGIVFDEKKQLLLVQRRDVPIWVLPGGGIEPGELPEKALCREVKEEAGIEIEIVKKCAEYRPVNALSSLTSLFLGKKIGGAEKISDETAAVAFFPLHALPRDFFFIHRLWLEESLKSVELIERPLVEVNYRTLFKYFLMHPSYVFAYLYTRFNRKNR